MIGQPGILQGKQHGGEKQDPRHRDAENALQKAASDQPSLFQQPPSFPHQEVKDQKDHLLDQEIIVHKGVDRHSQRQRSLLSLPGQLLVAGQHQREEGRRVMKMVEDQVHRLKSGEGIQQGRQRRVFFPGEAFQITVGACRRGGILRHIQPGDHTGIAFRGKQKGDPGKRASQDIKAQCSHKAGTQVDGPVPSGIPAFQRAVRQHVEGDLLFVKIISQREYAPSADQQKGKAQHRRKPGQGKHLKITGPPQAL